MLEEVFLRGHPVLKREHSFEAIFDDLNVFLRQNLVSSVLFDAHVHMKGK